MIVSGTNRPVSAKQVAAATIALAVAAAKPVAKPAPPPPPPKAGPNIAAILASEPTPAGPTTSTAKPVVTALNLPPETVIPGLGQQVGPNIAAILAEEAAPAGPTIGAAKPPPIETFVPAPLGTPLPPAKPSPQPGPTITPVAAPKPKYTPLSGAAAVDAMYADCDLYGIDALACAANAIHEGAGGGIGDGGSAFGPWQTHFLDGRVPEFVGESLYSGTVQDYAWSAAGFVFAIKGMAAGGARGLSGHDAVRAIVYGYEMPGDKPGQTTLREQEYDRLKAMGSEARTYLASVFLGPQIGGVVGGVPVTGPTVGTAVSYVPAGVNAQWRGLIDVFKTTSPATRAQIQSLNKSLLGVFK
ncbi:MAG: hypothetical protein KGL35_11420 [Bradyrhizobium sp.]|nr:hypothetical protein [Bradyrhizobium sp.]